MKVCANCFSDKELKGFILTSNEIGDCNVCNSNTQHLLDLTELYDFFQELIDNFRLVEDGLTLSSKIQADWTFFSSNNISNQVLNFVLPRIQTEITSSDDCVNYSNEIIANFGHWETLKDELKWKNRFVIDIHRLGKGEFNWDAFLRDINTQFNLTNNIELFRARIHHKSGLPVYENSEMGCPKKEIASGGRANPVGIPFLYLSEDENTVLYEIRGSYLDEISLATFQLNEDISSVDIVDFTKDSPLFQPYNVKDTIQGKLLRDRISKDLSKPMRRYDSELEYIPTQFICEYIKVFTGAKGIRFRSSLHREGNNIVFFEQSLMTCKAVKKVKIKAINLTAIDIN
ncbi:MAG: RES family NAD+ phosphorylase [bacterium]|nr:RES family NAD+ phosphorylase [bacterium]